MNRAQPRRLRTRRAQPYGPSPVARISVISAHARAIAAISQAVRLQGAGWSWQVFASPHSLFHTLATRLPMPASPHPLLLPHVLLMDCDLAGTDCIEATRKLLTLRPELRVILLATRLSGSTLCRALLAGACGYLVVPLSVPQLRQALLRAATGRLALCPRSKSLFLESFRAAERHRKQES